MQCVGFSGIWRWGCRVQSTEYPPHTHTPTHPCFSTHVRESTTTLNPTCWFYLIHVIHWNWEHTAERECHFFSLLNFVWVITGQDFNLCIHIYNQVIHSVFCVHGGLDDVMRGRCLIILVTLHTGFSLLPYELETTCLISPALIHFSAPVHYKLKQRHNFYCISISFIGAALDTGDQSASCVGELLNNGF